MLGINKLLAFLRRQVGLRTDAAAAAGSLHAKVAEELARIGAINPASGGTDTLFKYLRRVSDEMKHGPVVVATTLLSSADWVTAVNITGRGIFHGILWRTDNILNAKINGYEVLLDGTRYMYNAAATELGSTTEKRTLPRDFLIETNYGPSGAAPVLLNDVAAPAAFPLYLPFKTSLRINLRGGHASYPLYAVSYYSI